MQQITTDVEQYILNKSFDPDFQVQTFELLGYDSAGNVLRRVAVDASGNLKAGTFPTGYANKIVESGDYTYICLADPGSDQADAVWQCKRIDESVAGTTIITWADGNKNFDNVATDPTSLSYS